MDEVNEVLIILIRSGVTFKILMSIIGLNRNIEEKSKYLKKIQNVLIFYAVCESISSILGVAYNYYG